MHLATHVMAGWCAGNALRLTPKERAWCMAVSLLPDADGVSLLGGVEAYGKYHHVLAHNLTFGVIATVAIIGFARVSAKAVILLFALFHLHLLMDFYGSGEGWGIAYYWPWSDRMFYSSHVWSFSSWQNYSAFAGLIVWTLAIAMLRDRTPLEYLAPRLDRLALAALKRRAKPSPASRPADAELNPAKHP